MTDSKAEPIICFEAGSDQPPWAGTVASQDHHALENLNTNRVIVYRPQATTVEIEGTDRVGLVHLPSGRRLVLRSKIKSLILLEWLIYLGEFPEVEIWIPDTGITTGDEFHRFIAQFFLYELEKVTRVHLRKDYTPIFSVSPTIQGRVMTQRLFRRLDRLPRIPQRRRIRTFDSPHNMALGLALDRVPLLLANGTHDDHILLANQQDQMAHVSRDVVDPFQTVTEAQWASPPGYRVALQLARLILLGASLDPDTGVGGQAFTISLASIWERSLRRMMKELAPQTGWNPMPDNAHTRPWHDGAGQRDPSRWLRADVLLCRGNQHWVLDAKYKRSYGNESRNDRFQMCAYALAFNADRSTLVYPTAREGFHQRDLLNTTFGNKPVLIDSISLPMAAGPTKCREKLLELNLVLNSQ